VSIGFVGTDHTRAPLALRGRLAIDGQRLDLLYTLLRRDPLIAEAAVLSTCNRIEVYVAAPDIRAALGVATAHLLAVSNVSAAEAAGCLEQHVDEEAVRHLLAVAGGLRSLVVGEAQIGTQVREAFEDAARRAAGAELQALARAAVQCGKRVRSETALGAADTSVSAVIVALARRRLGGLHGRTALLIGAGRINEVSGRLLREAGIGGLVVVSRTRDAAARLAAACDGRDAAMDDLPALLAGADLAIAATRAPEPPVTPAAILPRDPARPLLLYDIAVPRDVELAVGALPGVELTDLDGLRAVTPRLEGARDGIDAAWRLVDACVERYAVEARARRAVPMIARLRAHVDSQKEAELARTLASLEHLAEADRAEVGMLAHRLVNRMFHHLATRLKAAAVAPEADTYLEALAFLFDETGTGAAHDERGGRHVPGGHDHPANNDLDTPTTAPASRS